MRHDPTHIATLNWTAVFALLTIASMLDPEHGILAAPSLFGAAPTPDAFLSGCGLLAAGFLAFALAAAGPAQRVQAAVFFRRVPAVKPNGGVR